jgi:hypothetical protein
MDQAAPGHLAQDVEVTDDQGVLGDEADRLLELGGNFQAATCQPELPLGRLIAIRVPRDGDGLGHPFRSGEELAEQLRGVLLDEDLGLEIEPGVQAQVLVSRAGVAIAAPMAASAVRIDAVAEGNVGAVVLGDDAPGAVGQVFGGMVA